MRSAVVNYLRRNGYLTQGFVGDGPVKMGFVDDYESDPENMVGLRFIQSEPCLGCEIVAIRIFSPADIEDNLTSASNFAQSISANKCFLAGPVIFDADHKETARKMGVGLLEIHGQSIKEVLKAKVVRPHSICLPKERFAGLGLAREMLQFSEEDLESIARVFSRADDAWCGFNVGGIFIEFRKNVFVLEVNISFRANVFRRWGEYTFKFGELAGFFVSRDDDRYTFVDNLGKMFVLTANEWNFMLNLLSRVDMCFLVFYIGTARIVFEKHPGEDGLDLKIYFVDGREGYEHHYSQEDLGKLTRKKK